MSLKVVKFKLFLLLGLVFHYIPVKRKKEYDLVIVRVDALGDYVLFHNSLRAYKEQYDGKRVLLICADIVSSLAKGELFYSDLFIFNRKKFQSDFTYFVKTICELKQIKTRHLLYPIFERHIMGDVIVSSIKSDESIGVDNNNIGRGAHFFNLFYTKLISIPKNISEIGAIELFAKNTVSEYFKYELRHINFNSINKRLEGLPDSYAVIAISASVNTKIWQPEKFAEIIRAIPPKYTSVLCGAGKEDIERAKLIMNIVSTEKNVINMIDKTSVIDMFSLISHSSFVIGNDSAAVHIAAASHIPSICIFHGAHFGRFLPYPKTIGYEKYHPRCVFSQMDCYGCGFHCKWPNETPFRCLDRVSVEMVKIELHKLIKELGD